MVIIYLLLAYGITNIVVFGAIFEWLREGLKTIHLGFIHSIFTCPMCFSTWLGFGLSYMLLLFGQPTPISTYFQLPDLITIFLDGCFTSGAVWLIFKIEDKLST
jgi:hypothetical protein